MKTTSWLVTGLVCALAGSSAAQPAKATPAPKKAALKARKAPVKQDLSPLVTQLTSTNQEAAVKAAETLGASTDPGAHEALLDALAWGMPSSVAVSAIVAVAQHPAPPDVAALERYATHHNPTVRSAAFGALAAYPHPDAQAAIARGLHDQLASVRGAAAAAAAKGRVRIAVEPLFALLAKGEEPAAQAVAVMADPELARKLGDQIGKFPDGVLAHALSLILKRNDFPDTARVDIVRTIGKIQGQEAVTALTDYIDAAPKNPPRQSRQEAEKMVEARLGGGK
jgi:HEAT repeat protein